MFILTILLSVVGIFASVKTDEEACHDKFEYVFKVMYRLSEVEKKLEIYETKNYSGEDVTDKLSSLTQRLQSVEKKLKKGIAKTSGDIFTRWGRSSCPNGSVLIYDGFAAGSHYMSEGGAANYVCLHKQPKWNDQTLDKTQNYIYGAEYEISGSTLDNIRNYDVPCAVCYVPSSISFMVPGRNICMENFTLQYSGYLMTNHDTHKSATEFVCVDDEPQGIVGTSTNHDGRLFYFVTAKCGSLKCPPYEEKKKVTCAVCSF